MARIGRYTLTFRLYLQYWCTDGASRTQQHGAEPGVTTAHIVDNSQSQTPSREGRVSDDSLTRSLRSLS